MDYASGACYQVFGDDEHVPPMTWSDAEKHCNNIAQGGKLVKITE
jgi:hypothetical protein